MVLLDTTTLLLLIEPTAKPPLDPQTKKPVEKCKERLEYLIETLSQAGTKIVIPTPVLAEVLVGAGSARGAYLSEIQNASAIQIIPFDMKSAIELSFLLDADGNASKKRLSRAETWAKVKFDRQIVAIAKAYSVKDLYTDDRHLGDIADANGIVAHHTWSLPLPPQKQQRELDLPEPEDSNDDET